MRLALRLAKRGAGKVKSNPMVGAVVVKDRQVIGKGYHKKFGGPHAEVYALQEAGEKARGATLYVNLEPCCHYGKTPPCTEKIIQAGIQRVVVAMTDPNPQVSGKGLRQLQEKGITVETGLLEIEARQLNAPFVKFMTRGLPYVTLKIAQTLDSKIADRNGHARWVSGKRARVLTHRWRWQAGAVLVGIGTVLSDNPRLTIRHVKGPQPLRLVLDSQLRIPLDAALVSDEYADKTIIFTRQDFKLDKARQLQDKGVKIVTVPGTPSGRLPLVEVLRQAAGMNIAHIFVEGGSKIFSSFIQDKLADHLSLIIAPKMFGEGIESLEFQGFTAEQPLTFENIQWKKIAPDRLFEADFVWR